MRSEARIDAAIVLTDQWLESMAAGRSPADSLVGNFFRARRYAGSKDRRFVSELFYALLRDLSALRAVQADQKMTGRGLVIAYLAKYDSENLSAFGMDSQHAPAALSEAEQQMVVQAQAQLSDADIDPLVKLNIPVYYSEGLSARFGDDLASEVDALNQSATLTVRVNPRKINVNQAFGKLVGDGYRIRRTEISPYGLVFDQKLPLGTLDLYKDGSIEVQDEAAQLASMAVGASKDQVVVDLCAGAGGKSLMVAALSDGKAAVTAFDIDGRRLKDLQTRAERAGAEIHTIQIPPSGSRRDNKILPYVDKADHVILDVPCSGTGTWRRNPDLRWRMDAAALALLPQVQLNLLYEGAELAKVGGHLYYMTCSLLPQENEAIVDQFISENPEFRRVDVRQKLKDNGLEAELSCNHAKNQQDILLSPKSHGSDGFYIAVLERAS